MAHEAGQDGDGRISRRETLALAGAAALAATTSPAAAQTAALKPGPTDALIVVDMQYDFLPGGALAVQGGDEIAPAINALGARFDKVVFTQDWHTKGHVSFASSHAGKKPFETIALPYGEQVLWPDHCVQGTRGAAITVRSPLRTRNS